ncbi:kinase-regulated stress-responsive transcription factor skn7 [Pestalotiopsis sp. 9143b]|nr:kinase-regulated stress-responsive transcription factor skn7 [Pestalotiopsis sp. 9143b]
MPEPEMSVAAGGSNNSSDFVRKLYKMLEDPSYSEVVRWGDAGDSFVVLENEKFTKTILPKHFKHSNFASFVRQLNKYDFHKVRQNEETGQSVYGQNAWEFKHPEFNRDAKHNLDNIRRKAPAPRKAQNNDDQFHHSSTQIVALTENVAAMQQQVQSLQESYFALTQANKVFVDEIVHLQRVVKAQSQVNHEVLAHLNKMDQSRRHARSTSNHASQAYTSENLMSDGTIEPAAELRRAREIMSSVSGDHIPERDLRQMSVQFQQVGASPESAGSGTMMGPPGSAGMQPNFMHDPIVDPRHMVYPVGQDIGIDPFAAEHLNNIPYNRPLSQNAMPTAPDTVPALPTISPPSGGNSVSPWGAKKPRILLVEDDRICSRIGSKFLANFDCGVEVARDGLEAVHKINANPNWFDLIFMDIVMPQLDGVSATAMIREVNPRIPIIAMTSNINQQDLDMYFHWGMKDVLAKPFTKEGMISKLRKHLANLMRNPPQPTEVYVDQYGNGQPPTPGPYSNPAMSLPISAASSSGMAKFETTPVQSPATSASWHSPGQLPHASPNLNHEQGYMAAGNGVQMGMNPGGPSQPRFPNTMLPAMTTGQGRMPEGMPNDGPPEKRQRLHGPTFQGQYPQ